MIVKKRLTVIQVLLVLIFVGCCGYLGKYFYDSHKAESGFDELKKVVAVSYTHIDVYKRQKLY